MNPDIIAQLYLQVQQEKMGSNKKKRSKPLPSPVVETPEKDIKNEKGDEPTTKKPKLLDPAIPKEKFEDLGGVDLNIIFEVAAHMTGENDALYNEDTAGMLICGPAACGKKMIIKCLAGRYEIPVQIVNSKSIVSPGKSPEKVIDHYLNLAYSKGRSIIIFDGVDFDGNVNESSKENFSNALISRIRAHQLANSDSQVSIFVTAKSLSNVPFEIRCSFGLVTVGIPVKKERFQILKAIIKSKSIKHTLDLEKVAHLTPGYVAKDLKALLIKAICAARIRLYQQMSPSQHHFFTFDELYKSQKKEDTFQNLEIIMEDIKEALKIIRPVGLKCLNKVEESTSLSDLGAMENVKNKLKEEIMDKVDNPDFYKEHNMSISSGILLYGPPGTGKTIVTRAMANEAGLNFIPIKSSDILNKYLGESDKKIREIFEQAKDSQPCILFFDEIDGILPARNDQTDGVTSRLVTVFLDEMSGIRDSRVFFIGATNQPQNLDEALLRSGRIGTKLLVDLPTPEERYDILCKILKNMNFQFNRDDVEKVAFDKCDRFNCADLHTLASKAALKLRKYKDEILSLKHFEPVEELVTPISAEKLEEYNKIWKSFLHIKKH